MSRIKFDVRYKGLLSIGYEAMDISNRDLDDMVYSGVYFGFNVVNAPDVNYVQVIVTRHNENWIVQEVKDYIDNIYLRSFKNEEWSEWTQLVVAHNCDEPDKEIIIVERPHTHALATPQTHGFMSAEDKAKLDSFTVDNDSGTIVPSEHDHPKYQEAIDGLDVRVTTLEENIGATSHDHDDRYLLVCSEERPANHTIAGQVWIETFNS